MCPSFHHCMPFSDNSPVCVEGALPLSSTFCPYRARYLLNPIHGGPRVSFTPFTLPWAEIPLPLQGAAASKPLKYNVVCVLIRATRPQNH